MRLALAAIGLAVLSACASTVPHEQPHFSAARDEVMVFAPAALVEGEGAGYTALVYRGMRGPDEAIFERLPYPQPPQAVTPTEVRGVFVPAEGSRAAPRSRVGEPGDVVAVLDARQGAVMGVEDVSIVVLSATPEAVSYRVERQEL
jgi:hypothetical protein